MQNYQYVALGATVNVAWKNKTYDGTIVSLREDGLKIITRFMVRFELEPHIFLTTPYDFQLNQLPI